MRSGIRGALAGVLALVALQTLVQPSAAGRVGALFGVPAKAARAFLDPTVPAIKGISKGVGRSDRIGTGLRADGTSSTGAVSGYPSPWEPPTTRPTPPGGE